MTLSPLNFRELTFLVVDDESLILDIVTSMLQNLESKKVHKATSGMDALNYLSDSNIDIDCVISDHGMEPMTGLELLQHIREGRNAGMVKRKWYGRQPLWMLTVTPSSRFRNAV